MKKIISFTLTVALLLSVLAGVGLSAKKARAAAIKVLDTPIQASEPATTNTYEIDADTAALTIPVSIQKTGIVEFKVTFQGFSEKAYCVLQKNKQFSSAASNIYSLDVHGTNEVFTAEHTASQPMTCYLFLMTTDADESKSGSVTVTSTFKEATTGREVKPGETVNAVQASKEEYYKIKLANHAKVTIKGDTTSLTLHNAAKKYISGCDKTMYLKKGTYYLLHSGSGTYSFSYTTKKITLPKNTSKKKAKKIKLKKAEKGIFTRGLKTQSCWYKITLKKNKKLTVKYKNTVGENARVLLLNTKGKLVGLLFNSLEGKKGTGKMFFGVGKKLTETIKKGTYYIKIEQGGLGEDHVFSVTFK